ncbi:protein FRIGIDA-ESSENTIAL 1 [Sesamum angolense]|uniref:Protein FRIGIDA-ESSENTIAL 1 n=1 Tax=Sesamum angolense TaxID=2727404 RepID=A0AAE1WT19_9LAMI|nr:protein FRIGIDA-ESSENTIAL 1 [Sesamum angolense]
MASVMPPPPPKSSTSGNDDGEDEIEYEEIEEEVEVEEEVEEALKGEGVEEGNEHKIGEDLTPARDENQETATIEMLEPQGHSEQKQSGSASQSISISNPPTGERTSWDNDPKAPFYKIGEVNRGRRSPLLVINTALTTGYASSQKDNAIISVTTETNHRAAVPVGKLRQMSPRFLRLHVPQIRLRDPSPTAEFDRDNKKLKIPCEFFAKGWCVRGNSCRFLHIGDGSAVVKTTKGTYEGNFSGSSVASHDNHHDTRISAFGSTLPEMIAFIFWFTLLEHQSLGTPNLLKSGVEHHASVPSSLKRSISSVSGSESESQLGNHVFKDTDLAKYTTKISYDWEPSAPFRPSHAITRNLLLKENLYNPIRDSIGHTGVKDGQVKFSDSEQGSTKNLDVPSNSSLEEKLLNSVHVGDTVKGNIFLLSSDNKLNDNPRHKTELKVDGSDKNNEADVDLKGAGQLQSESKAFKYFQSALIEFVKELVKPTWREGLMSKDAHKLIVKKAVDKVLSTLQPHQIPSTGESVNLYLSASKPKLAKLVEGYIDKYGKS